MIINLSRPEYEYLIKAHFVPSEIRAHLLQMARDDTVCRLSITEDEADQLRELCGQELQVSGFDEDYEATPEGRILEKLIDVFYTG